MTGLIPIREDKTIMPQPTLEKLFVFGLMWSLGCVLELGDRAKMEAFIKSHKAKLDLPAIPAV